MAKPRVIDALRRFLPAFLSTQPVLSAVQRRAIWALENCRTAEMGGHVHGCAQCGGDLHFAYHSCNHKCCPQCGSQATADWVQREQNKLLPVPYFMVTFTLPSEARELFFAKSAKEAYDAYFKAVAATLNQQLALYKDLKAAKAGFTMVLHTWNQRLMFHPHIHCIVPGAGLNEKGEYVQVKYADFLAPVSGLKKAFKYHFRQELKERGIEADPDTWRKDWVVNIRPFGDGTSAVKYLGRYVSRSAIGDKRMVSITESHVKFEYEDRKGGVTRIMTLTGVEFVRRFLRHVLPAKMHSVRYGGFCHPTAKKTREAVLAGSLARQGAAGVVAKPITQETRPKEEKKAPLCPCCQRPMVYLGRLGAGWRLKQRVRGPPSQAPPHEEVAS